MATDQANDLLITARKLAHANTRRPRQSDLQRAISTAYYAAFHALAKECADRLVGTGNNRSDNAWVQAYRALEHGSIRSIRQQTANLGFPDSIVNFVDTCLILQEARNAADYHPDTHYSLADVRVIISQAQQAIRELRRVPRRDRAALAILLLLKRRSN